MIFRRPLPSCFPVERKELGEPQALLASFRPQHFFPHKNEQLLAGERGSLSRPGRESAQMQREEEWLAVDSAFSWQSPFLAALRAIDWFPRSQWLYQIYTEEAIVTA